MTTWLKQSTAADVVIGPFVDDTDGKTPETGLTISQADCQLSKNGGAVAQKNDATSASHLGGGHYKVPLNATDTGTLGRLRLYVNETGALPVWLDFMVVPANVYDSLIGGSDALQVDVSQWNNSAVATPATAGYPVVTHKVGTGTGEMNLSGGRTPADVTHWSGAAVATPATAGHPVVTQKVGTGVGEMNLSGGRTPADVTHWNGAAVATPATAGHPVVTHKVGTGTGEMNLSGGRTPADVTHWNGAPVATPATAGYPVVTQKVGTGTGELSISSGVVSADATRISGDSVAADNAEKFFDGTGYAGTNNAIPTVGTVTGAVGSVTGNVGGNVTGSVGSLAAQAKADVNAEVVDVLATDTFAEPGSVPAATSSLKDKIGWLFMLARNKRVTSATTDAVRNDADSADVGTAALSDNGTSFSRGEYA